MEFTKAHGTGNDFVVLEDLEDRLDLSDDLVRALCDRRRGIGGDGVLRLGAGPDGSDVFMDYRNADGGIVEMCGNGVRVVATYLARRGLTGDEVRVATRAGVKPVEVLRDRDGVITGARVDMGPPILEPGDIPFLAEHPGALTEPIEVDGTTVEVAAVSMGNPHAVIVVADVATAPVTTLGPKLEVHERFPQGVNVEFAAPWDGDQVDLRVWERGVGETLACGTGACATVVALQRLGHLGEEVAVHLPGGVLTVAYREEGPVTLTGPAVEVATATIAPDWLATVTGEETSS